MKPRLKITGAGNVVVPAYLALQKRGYAVRRERQGGETTVWIAQSESIEVRADDPATLLSLVGIAETRGERWEASDDEIRDFLNQFGAA